MSNPAMRWLIVPLSILAAAGPAGTAQAHPLPPRDRSASISKRTAAARDSRPRAPSKGFQHAIDLCVTYSSTDAHPWSSRVMAAEMLRQGKVEPVASPDNAGRRRRELRTRARPA
jgi:hypothetical protein